MPSKGKAKGNQGELKIAKFLTETFGAKFMRVPNSGAYLGGGNAHRKLLMDDVQINYFKSDIIPPHHMRKLVIESKFYKSFPFEKLAGNDRITQLESWIKQILTTVDADDMWVLVVRINHKGSWACFDAKWLPHLQVGNHVRHFEYVWCDFESLFTRNRDQILNITHTS
jgi:hypothetical protein